MSNLKELFKEYSLKNGVGRDQLEQNILKDFLHEISEDKIKELGDCYSISPELYCSIMYSIVDGYDVLPEVERVRLDILLKNYTPVKRIPTPTSVQQMVEKTDFIPTSEVTTMKNLFSFEGSEDKLAQLLNRRLLVIDKSSKNNVTYQLNTLVDYEFIKSKDLVTQVMQGVDQKVIERTNTILTYKGNDVHKTGVKLFGIEYDSQPPIVVEKIGNLYRTIKCTYPPERVTDPSLEVEAYNGILSKQILSHVKYIEVDSNDNMKMKTETYALRDKLLQLMVDFIQNKIEDVESPTQLFSSLKRSDFIKSMTKIIADNVVKEVEEQYENEISYTLSYELSHINPIFSNAFYNLFKEEKKRVYEIFEKYSDKKVIRDNVIFVIKGVIQKVLKQIIPDRKGITQGLITKYNILKSVYG
jgi:hypothetical protein